MTSKQVGVRSAENGNVIFTESPHDISHGVMVIAADQIVRIDSEPGMDGLPGTSTPKGLWGRTGFAAHGSATTKMTEKEASEPLSAEDRRARDAKLHIPLLGEIVTIHERSGMVISTDLEHRTIFVRFDSGMEVVSLDT